jgi:hypothetical protein
VRCILVGYGQIGRAVTQVFSGFHDIDTYDITDEIKPKGIYDLLLVCIPYSKDFVKAVNAYRKEYEVQGTIIFSTVPIGTTRKIPGAVHSPVEGKHPDLAESILLMPRWIGGQSYLATQFFEKTKMEVRHADKPEFTEFLKLQSTSNYGINIEWARYCKWVSDRLGMDYDLVKRFNRDYNELYLDLNLDQFQRYILDPPKGNIGGHCVVPNARMLDAQYPNLFLKEIYRDKEGCG